MPQNFDVSDRSFDKIDHRAVIALLVGAVIGAVFWSGLFVLIAG